VCEGDAGHTEFGEEEGEDEPDGASSDDEHRQMRRVSSSSAARKGREGWVLAAPVPRDSAAVQGEEAPAPATGDRRHRPDELSLGGGGMGWLQLARGVYEFRKWARLYFTHA
jgi:hypothetical protein